MRYLDVQRGGGRDMLVVLGICLLTLLENLLTRIVLVEVGLDLCCRLSPGFHQKVETENLQEYVSFLVRVGVQSQIPLILASIVLVVGLVFVRP